jgi:Translation elongation factor EF-1beta|nr:MAG: translation elongation factor EF-1beta [Candidatus Nanosalinarum sp. J07AB56]
MAKIAVVLKVMPEEAETDLDALEREVRDTVGVDDLQTEDVAFGLKALKVSTVVDDEQMGMEGAKESLEGIDEVQSVEIESFNKI